MDYAELLEHCEGIKVALTQEECKAVESSTQAQARCKLWNRFRSGRITASRMKAACHSKPSAPSRSLINAICHPGEIRIKTAATEWGCSHEKKAKETYKEAMCMLHDNFVMKDSGLVLNPSYPLFGASPDALCSCDCCGEGVVEVIKCPYCVRSSNLDEQVNSCLKSNDDGSKSLIQTHQYFYQVQTQIFLCQKEFCDFVIWTEKEVHIERIDPSDELWNSIVDKAGAFHKMAVMPELAGKFFLRAPPLNSCSDRDNNQMPETGTTNPTGTNQDLFCICQQPETDEMIACDNENCRRQWFHFQCMKMTSKSVPKGKWYCHDCKTSSVSKKKESKMCEKIVTLSQLHYINVSFNGV